MVDVPVVMVLVLVGVPAWSISEEANGVCGMLKSFDKIVEEKDNNFLSKFS